MPPIDKEFQTSFIPKKPLTQDTSYTREKPVSLLNVLATIIFFATLAVGVVFYFYKLSINDSIKRMSADLDRAQASFEPALINELQTLDRRISASKDILDRHIAVTPIMEALSLLTLKSVQFTDFNFDIPQDNKSSVSVSIKGKAKSYTSIALQGEELKKQTAFLDPIFSNLSLDTKGNVVFELNFRVDPSFVSYENTVTDTPDMNQDITSEGITQ